MTVVPRDVEDALLFEAMRRGPVTLVLKGLSMTPCIPSGARVELHPVSPSSLRRGMVVAFLRAGQLVVHRVIALDGERVKTRGDAEARDDGWTPRTQVIAEARRTEWRGRVVELRPEDGFAWRAGGALFRRYYALRKQLRPQ